MRPSANLGFNLHVRVHGDHEITGAQALHFLDMGPEALFPDWKLFRVQSLISG